MWLQCGWHYTYICQICCWLTVVMPLVWSASEQFEVDIWLPYVWTFYWQMQLINMANTWLICRWHVVHMVLAHIGLNFASSWLIGVCWLGSDIYLISCIEVAYIGLTRGWNTADMWLTFDWHVANMWLIYHWQVTDKLLKNDWHMAEMWLTLGWNVADYGLHMANIWPTYG